MSLKDIFAARTQRMKASEIRELLKLLDQPGILSFAGGIPDPELFPSGAFAEAMADIMETDSDVALQYSVSEGYLPLRQWIADHMATIGVPCEAQSVLITSGSQQALDYLGKLFLSPGDTALVNWPTYMGALGAFNPYEPRYGQLSVNGNRSASDYAAEAEASNGRVKFAYLSADFSNPTGETVDQRGREALLAMADELDCAVIEDAAYQALRYEGQDVPPILALELARKGHIDSCRTIYCGSFSKTLSPGLRVGWVVAAQSVIQQLVLMKQAADLHSSTFNQMAVHRVAEKCFEDHVHSLRTVYGQRRGAMLKALDAYMPEGVSWTRPEGGMFVWVTLPRGIDGAGLLTTALDKYQLAFVPGRAFFADGSGGNTLRLSFSCADEAMIDEGMQRLGQAIRTQLT
ncbi:PLP-dependent aminotransferase family protein [uncultured Shimia sp.]|uniref:aminotransferase-like domain-containing protein n=1 Tax=uncultured Shimia sp. TaxID=573152 RepID=UPI0026176FA4|nr:PLP-dependent aminotransferase family protein [uncultured Shimia sp.]